MKKGIICVLGVLLLASCSDNGAASRSSSTSTLSSSQRAAESVLTTETTQTATEAPTTSTTTQTTTTTSTTTSSSTTSTTRTEEVETTQEVERRMATADLSEYRREGPVFYHYDPTWELDPDSDGDNLIYYLPDEPSFVTIEIHRTSSDFESYEEIMRLYEEYRDSLSDYDITTDEGVYSITTHGDMYNLFAFKMEESGKVFHGSGAFVYRDRILVFASGVSMDDTDYSNVIDEMANGIDFVADTSSYLEPDETTVDHEETSTSETSAERTTQETTEAMTTTQAPTTTTTPATTTTSVTTTTTTPETTVANVDRESANALEAAQNYLSVMAFSKAKLFDQLTSEYGEGYSGAAAEYAVNHVSANWKEQALKSAQNYLEIMPMSYKKLYEQLSSEHGEQFTAEEARYAVDNVGANWNEQALKSAQNYLEIMPMSTERLFEQLSSEYGEQFTAEEAQYAIDNLD